MPTCSKCGVNFPNRLEVEGKVLSSRRRLCLQCSPFKNHNTKRIHQKKQGEGLHTCERCERRYTYTKAAGHTLKFCNSCVVNCRRFELKKKMIDYKGGVCEKCGYSQSRSALVFHHIDETTKSFNISGSHARSWQTLKKELDKCKLLCANCHAEEHEKLSGWGFFCPDKETARA